MRRVRLQMEETEVAATDSVSSTRTGRCHHLKLQGDGLSWLVSSRSIAVSTPQPLAPLDRRDMQGALCSSCGNRKARKGGKNVNHKFICAECSR